jgi:hypothetical protein
MRAIQRLIVTAERVKADIRRPEQLAELPGVMALRKLLGGIIAANPGAQQWLVYLLAA